MRNAGGRVALALLVAVPLTAGCATSARSGGLNSRLIRPAPKGAPPAPAPYATGGPQDSLETAIGKIRELSMRARPRPKDVAGITIESLDPQLGAVLLALRVLPSPEAYRRVAQEYVRLRVLDAAFSHYRAAVRLDPRDGAAYDGLARIWRDWKLPGYALGDARRAVYFASGSPEAYNTLGTVYQSLGRYEDAKRAYTRSLELEPAASYALNNLGYVLLLEGNPAAIDYFHRAIASGGHAVVPRHNLALVYAAMGRLALARRELVQADAPAAADYNLGIIHLARRDEASALSAFEAACRVDPTRRLACSRASSLRSRQAAAGGTP